MQIYITVVLLLSSGAVSGGLEKVFRLAEFIADIYRQFPHSCIFIINPEAQQQCKGWIISQNIPFPYIISHTQYKWNFADCPYTPSRKLTLLIDTMTLTTETLNLCHAVYFNF